MTSLQDQLLNMGVVNKKKAKKSQHQQRQDLSKQRKAIKSGKKVESTQLQQQLEQSVRDKHQRDLVLNKQRDEQRQQKALTAEVKQIVQQHSIAIAKEAELAYNFTFENKVKKIYVTTQQQKQLTLGQLAIATVDQAYLLIPDKIAEKIERRLPGMVIRTQIDAQSNDDDSYADYPIPDDLMW